MNISGIHIEKSTDGALKSVTFDAQKYEAILRPILEDLGVIDDHWLQKKFFSMEEAKAETKKRILAKCGAQRKS